MLALITTLIRGLSLRGGSTWCENSSYEELMKRGLEFFPCCCLLAAPALLLAFPGLIFVAFAFLLISCSHAAAA